MNELLGRYGHFMVGNTEVTVADKILKRSLTDISDRRGCSNHLNWKECVGLVVENIVHVMNFSRGKP